MPSFSKDHRHQVLIRDKWITRRGGKKVYKVGNRYGIQSGRGTPTMWLLDGGKVEAITNPRNFFAPTARPKTAKEASQRFEEFAGAVRCEFTVTKAWQEPLHAIAEDEAWGEGGYTVASYRDEWERLNGKWDDDQIVTVVHFEITDELYELYQKYLAQGVG